jgi:prophage maintenance system killer protein
VIVLEVADLIVIASRTLGVDTAAALELVDPAAAELALSQVQPDSEPGDLARPAAVLLCALVRGRPLRRGNRQVALAATLQFLTLNGQELNPDPPEAVAAMIAAIASGGPTPAEVADWLTPRLRPAAQMQAFPTREETTKATYTAAEAQTRINEAFSGISEEMGDVGLALRMQARAGAIDELLASGALEDRAGGGTDAIQAELDQFGRTAADKKEEPMRARPALPLAERIRKATTRRQPTGPLRRFTDEARRSVQFAGEEARLLRHNYVGTEHLLLGLVAEEEGLAAQALKSLGLSLAEIRHQVTEIATPGQHAPSHQVPFTPQARRVLELSLREALSLGHHYIGTEHLLLGLLGEERGIAARVLTGLGADHDRVRERLVDLINQIQHEKRERGQALQTTLAELADTQEQLNQVRARKEAALDAEDFEAAGVLRDQERELLAERARLGRQVEAASETAGVIPAVLDENVLQAVLNENQKLQREVDRLRGLLRDHGIEPDNGTAQPA